MTFAQLTRRAPAGVVLRVRRRCWASGLYFAITVRPDHRGKPTLGFVTWCFSRSLARPTAVPLPLLAELSNGDWEPHTGLRHPCDREQLTSEVR